GWARFGSWSRDGRGRGARPPRPRAVVSRPGGRPAQGFVQGSTPDPDGSSPNLPILKPGPCTVRPVVLEAALGQAYAMSCTVGNTQRPSVSTYVCKGNSVPASGPPTSLACSHKVPSPL